jgi:C4-dicarboxylate transporter, DctM subunit
MIWFLPLMLLIFIGLPVAFSLGILGFLGLVINLNWNAASSQFTTILFGATNSYPLSCIPMFILMGELCYLAGITDDIFKAANVWFGRLRGGLAIATCFACAAFGACSGSTIASASVFTKMTFPKMVESGYDKRLASGVIASAGALACMIPPSILMVIYGIIASQPINKLLIAGFVPGIMTALLYAIGIYLLVRFVPKYAPQTNEDRVSFKEKLIATKRVLGLGFLFALVMGGLFIGLFTSTGAGAIGAMGALIILLTKKRFKLELIKNAISSAGILSCSLLFIIAFGNLFSFVISTSGELERFTSYLIELKLNPTVLLILLAAFYFILGCMIDPTSMLIITLPPIIPIAEAYGFHPVWFGIIVITMLEIGVMTPPVGMNVYTVKAVAGDILTVSECFVGTSYFVILILISLAITIAFPDFILWLPSFMD